MVALCHVMGWGLAGSVLETSCVCLTHILTHMLLLSCLLVYMLQLVKLELFCVFLWTGAPLGRAWLW